MAKYAPEFNVREFELRNTLPYFLSPDQESSLELRTQRVPAQLDWVAQLLGWSGNQYWNSLVSSVDQRRQLLTGTFGAYGSFAYPEIVEIRNWENCIVVKPGIEVLVGDTLYVGGKIYSPIRVESSDEGNTKLFFSDLDEDFFRSLASGDQLKLRAKRLLPAPFNRSDVKASADYDFHCFEAGEGMLGLSPSYDLGGSQPLKRVSLFKNSRYTFDKPVSLALSSVNILQSTYNPRTSRWEILIPCNIEVSGTLAEISYSGLSILADIRDWTDPSDWYNDNILDNFTGVWANKGGFLPLHFCFDALSIHGYNQEDSLLLEPLHREIEFDRLLNFVYYQTAHVSPYEPDSVFDQVWWNPQTGVFSVYNGDPLNCGPWVEIDYPKAPSGRAEPPGYVFSNVSSFRAYTDEFESEVTIRILSAEGLTEGDNVFGLYGPLRGSCLVDLIVKEEQDFFTLVSISVPDVDTFEANSGVVSEGVVVMLQNSAGLEPDGGSYMVLNLKETLSPPNPIITRDFRIELDSSLPWTMFEDYQITSIPPDEVVSEAYLEFSGVDTNFDDKPVKDHRLESIDQYPVVLTKDGSKGVNGWYISPPSNIKYIGKTRLFQSSEDWTNPVDGELYWEYRQLDVERREASVFYYDTWVIDPSSGKPALTGAWVNINGNPSEYPKLNEINFSSIFVFHNGSRLLPGKSAVTDDYELSFDIVQEKGTFKFSYEAKTLSGISKTPTITITDSVTTTFEHDISDLVFSGMVVKALPYSGNSESLLRLTKYDALYSVEEKSEINSLRCPNPLVAGENNGPGDDHWERYFVRLPLDYQRYGPEWQKVVLLCQGFGYWGSSINPENMRCPNQKEKPEIYEELYLYRLQTPSSYVYQEAYLFSACVRTYSSGEDYDNSVIVPDTSAIDMGVKPARIESYDPLHSRKADVESPVGSGYGEWLGSYYRASRCSAITGNLVEDLVYETLEPVEPPVWDASIYKIPQTCVLDQGSGSVDANHYKIGYALFTAGLSAAGEAVYEIG